MKSLSCCHQLNRADVVLLDFDGVFTDNNVIIDERGTEYVKCSRYDGFGISALLRHGITVAVLTTEAKPLARQRCSKLGIPCFDALEDKLSFGSNYIQSLNHQFESTLFLGNDINDLELLRRVGIPVVTSDCHPSVCLDHFYQTKLPGGHGCIRELADLILSSRT